MTEKMQILISTLIDQYYLYKHYHWNYEGNLFYQYHNLFDEHATKIHESQDEIAERVRQLGVKINSDIASIAKYSILETADRDNTDQSSLSKILSNLQNSHLKVISLIEEIIAKADDKKDYSTADMLTKYLEDQQKMEWFIRVSKA